ncbi:MAG: hypothetical protein OXH00_02780 [Candidatus Poribacteria bacterium]|nr:hypothetical protein [Candidatus Poribacteria bacterium]
MDKAQMIKKYSRRIKRPLPEYDLPKPPGPFKQNGACVIFALFEAYEGVIPHYVINSAFWAAHSWRVNTDLIAKEWDIYFLVDSKLWAKKIVRDQFEKANLRNSVLLFEVPRGCAIRHKLGAKLYAATVPYFQDYHRCYLVDTDMFVSIRDQNNILPTDRLLDIGKDESLFMTYSYGNRLTRRRIAPQKYEFETEAEARPIYDSYVEKYLGHPQTVYWQVSGQLFAWNPQQLREDFKAMIMELTPNISDDEEQYGLYLEKTGERPEQLRKIWRIPIHFAREDYFSDEPYYFDHIWLDSNAEDSKNWAALKKEGVQTREKDPLLSYNETDIKDIWRENIGIHRRINGQST